jgi:hypothetical protein
VTREVTEEEKVAIAPFSPSTFTEHLIGKYQCPLLSAQSPAPASPGAASPEGRATAAGEIAGEGSAAARVSDGGLGSLQILLLGEREAAPFRA